MKLFRLKIILWIFHYFLSPPPPSNEEYPVYTFFLIVRYDFFELKIENIIIKNSQVHFIIFKNKPKIFDLV